MDFIISEKEKGDPTICLNMIVKNESRIIKDTLEKLCQKITFSYWVICDTGSTDNTQEIIKAFFVSKNIPGELYQDTWVNFAHNRTLALQYAFNKTDLLLVFDADDEIVGDIQMPRASDTIHHEYHLKFGSSLGISYTRVLLINNKKRFMYQSVIHEFISCLETEPITNAVIEGNYFVVSGRSGNRSQDPDKYLKDAKVLEAAHAEALLKKDPLHQRYAFYCANSYKDHGLFEEAIKWYKITLTQDNWSQEKYVSCLYIYDCYEKLNQKETGFFYLVKAFKYDAERVECLYPLLVHYCCEGQHQVAYNYYLMVKDYYENHYLTVKMDKKLFITIDKYNFYVPYYMILIADKVKDTNCIIRMFEIVFIKKMPITDMWSIRNFLYNLQFFVDHVKPENKKLFIYLANEYFKFLHDLGIPLNTIECLKDYDKRFGIDVSYIFYNLTITDKNKYSIFSKEQCASSKNILIYTGFMYFLWNDTYVSNKSIGGAEKAVAYLSRYFSKEYKIFISGDVEDEVIDNITYINRNKLQNLLETTHFHTIIVSRYISFFLMYKNFSCYKLFLSAHDSTGLINNFDNNRIPLNDIIETWNPIIDGCIALTNWHKNNIITAHPSLKDKIHIINNGIIPELFNIPYKKIRNKFVWTSCSYRGLHLMLNLWNEILDNIPDATLDIASYDTFPKNANDEVMLEFILKYPDSIKLHGKLNTTQLINLISSAEYWLYTNTFPETSCITGMEMLMSQVICLYYPLAGLLDTVGEYGIQVNPGSEIDTILNLTEKQKIIMRKRGKEYALSCSWSNRAKEWENVLFKDLNKERERIYELHNIGFIPKNHVDFLKKLSIDFIPKVIYDIGANVLTWTREVKQIWSNTEIFAFDAIKTAEFFYKENNVKYHIGVLSNEDNYPVKFYENIVHPAGNSYYKEIGHTKSNEIYPEDKFSEQIAMTLNTVVRENNFLLPDLIKIDVQGAELDIIKGGLDVINNAKYLIVELQDTQYNRGAPLAATTIKFLEDNDWELIAPKFCDNGPDADYCFKNKRYDSNFKIKIINLNRRPDRKEKMINQMKLKDIKNYDFFEAIDGKKIESSIFIKKLFKDNNFNYRKGVIGCALSHYNLWHKLLNDKNNNYYVIFEDDISIVDNFNEKLQKCFDIINKNDIEYALIGSNYIHNECSNNTIISFHKEIVATCNGTYGYIISKSGCYKLINSIKTNGIKYAIDDTEIYRNCLDMYKINNALVTSKAYHIHNNMDTNIQLDYDHFNFDSIPSYSIAFTDWWVFEYCGGSFDPENNFIKNLLSEYYNIQVIKPEQNPDILFYSVFGNDHKNFKANKKIFFSGESYPQREDADFNVTFDKNSDKNCRLPLWVCYLDNILFEDCYKKKIGSFNIPSKSKFCSIICQADSLNEKRSEIVNKLSKYKQVDCGGKFLNNIGYLVPRGINCSGKIEHNNNYKFVLAFENKIFPGYVTEKICDVYKSRCIPIYHGSNAVVSDFNPKTFINANDFINFDELVKYIQKVDNDQELYESYFKEPIFSDYWLNIFNDFDRTFFSNLANNIVSNYKLVINK
jgi:FkbM family methyltransferase